MLVFLAFLEISIGEVVLNLKNKRFFECLIIEYNVVGFDRNLGWVDGLLVRGIPWLLGNVNGVTGRLLGWLSPWFTLARFLRFHRLGGLFGLLFFLFLFLTTLSFSAITILSG